MKFKKIRLLKLLKNPKFWWFGAGGLLAVVLLWFVFTPHRTAVQYGFPGIPKTEEKPERINVLLLGMAGGKHDGATLTDSIIVASYHIKTNKVVMFSIPRDLWVEEVRQKVNTLYQTGLKEGNGLVYAKEKIGKEIMGIPIDYAVRVDFSGFAKAIDLVGGIEVDVPKKFDDYNYPIEGKENDLCGNKEEEIEVTPEQAAILKVNPGKQKVIVTPEGHIATEAANFACRFEHIKFEKGKMKMNGAIALKFVRSRMGTNQEGTDFARSRRQQLAIEAFRNKVLSLETLANPQKVTGLVSTLGESLEMDIPLDKYLEFYKYAKSIKNIESVVLGDLGNGQSVLINPPAYKYGGYVLIPPDGDFTVVKNLVKEKLDEQASTTPKPTPTSTPTPTPKIKSR